MSLWNERVGFQKDLRKLITYAEDECGYECILEEIKRPLEMQVIYYKTGRSKTMNSRHLEGLAGDLAFKKNGKLTYDVPELGKFWESLNIKNRWGGFWKTFKDKPHFERLQ